MEYIRKQWQYEDLSTATRIAAGTTLLFAELIGLIGNVFVLIIIIRILKHRRNIPNILICILVILDLLSLPLTYTQAIMSHFSGFYVGGQMACDYHATAIAFCKYSSIVTIALISLDRCIALSYPFCYKDHLSYDDTRKYRLFVLIVPLFAVTLILSFLPLIGMSRNVLQFPGSYCLFDMKRRELSSAVLLGMHISFLGTVLVLVTVANVVVCVQAYRLIQKIKPSLRVSKREAKIQRHKDETSLYKKLTPKQERKLLRTSLLTIAVFYICWLPFLIRFILVISGTPFSAALDFIAARLASLQSVLNPWIYPVTRKQYRSAFRFLFILSVSKLSFGLIEAPTNSLDEIIDARTGRREALRYYRERKVTQITGLETIQHFENIELSDTNSQLKPSSSDDDGDDDEIKQIEASSVSFMIEEENANVEEGKK